MEENGTLPNSFYKATITLTLIPGKSTTNKLQTNFMMNIDVICSLQKISKPNSTIYI